MSKGRVCQAASCSRADSTKAKQRLFATSLPLAANQSLEATACNVAFPCSVLWRGCVPASAQRRGRKALHSSSL
eukprot:13181374-Alexandrium_andersonii.AAC.1